MTPIELWQARLQTIYARADRLDRAYRLRANACAARAGLNDARNVWANAIISKDAGKPWAGVDYSALREAEYWDRRRSDIYDATRRLADKARAGAGL